MGQRLTTMTSGQTRFPVAPSMFKFTPARPVAARGSANCCRTRPRWSTNSPSSRPCTPRPSTTTRPVTFIQTGNQLPGQPSLGAWLAYGLGSENQDLPAFVVLHSDRSAEAATPRPCLPALWGSGFLPVRTTRASPCAAPAIPVLYLSRTRAGVSPATRRKMLDALEELNRAPL